MQTWQDFFREEESKSYYIQLMRFLTNAYHTKTIYPPKEDLFTCFEVCPYEAIKVVILGQDPYHQPKQAHGLSFSVRKGCKLPPSLVNIYKELESDVHIARPSHGCLLDWARQGVFLMNTIMSVEEGKAGSHKNQGWEIFSDHVIQALNKSPKGIVFIFWGNWAKNKRKWITNPKHRILCSAHPSPLSAHRGFFGSQPFSKTNALLMAMGREPIDWRIQEDDV